MGHKITTEGLKPDGLKIEAITNMSTPSNKKVLLCFLGMCNFIAEYNPRITDA